MDRRETDRRDQELLDKHVRRFGQAPRHDGTMILGLVALFLAGMTFGAVALAYKGELTRTVGNTSPAVHDQPITAMPIAR